MGGRSAADLLTQRTEMRKTPAAETAAGVDQLVMQVLLFACFHRRGRSELDFAFEDCRVGARRRRHADE